VIFTDAKFNYSGIPAALRALPNWVCWRIEKAADGRKTKRPYNVASGKWARTDDPATWTSFDKAADAYQRGGYDGIGLVFSADCGFWFIDLDTVRDAETGAVAQDAQELLYHFNSACYIEISVSGFGYHIIGRGSPNLTGGNRFPLEPNGIARLDEAGKHKAPEVEFYTAGRFCALTGTPDILWGSSSPTWADSSADVEAFHRRFVERKNAVPERSTGEQRPLLSDDELIDRARKYEKFDRLWRGDLQGYPSQSEADLALCNMLAYWTGRDAEQMDRIFRQSGLMRGKWDRKQSGSTYGALTIKKAVNECPRVYSGRATAKEDFYAVKIGASRTGPEPTRKIDPLSNLKRYTPDEIGAARLFADMYRNVIAFVPDIKMFRVYDGTRWADDEADMQVRQAAKSWSDYVREVIPQDKEGAPEDKFAVYRKFYSKYRLLKNRKALIEDVQDELAHRLRDFDRNPCLLNLKNGTFNLQTGKIQPHKASDMLSKMANVSYNPAAKCDRFEQFIYEVTEGKAERARMLQTALGYALTGEPREECLFIATGLLTRNGKGTLFDTVLNILGDYGAQIDFNTLARGGARDGSRATPDLARLVGIRFVLSNEPEKGICFNEALLKQLTGGDEIVARPLYGRPIQFKPAFTIFITANSNPTVSDDSLFASDRIKLLPFNRHFSEDERDTSLKGQFRTEEAKSGIFNWLIRGFRMYQKDGLHDTDEMRALVAEYRLDNDYIQQYFDERFDFGTPGEATLKNVRLDYARWCEDVGTKPLGLKLFKEELQKRGIKVHMGHNHILVIDGRLKLYPLPNQYSPARMGP
jgi:putative DNA primase/helicase